ncbi:MAG: hypothetical protein LBG79_08325 [Spirochaetaceae bacterium]|jgi:hypothetical protein|nr:hypothetical protein [Spirochaetaceae bacterium]GMO21018.1 MAG: hypothetical protein Pg6A_08000 [Termitinemataceae bacterium]
MRKGLKLVFKAFLLLLLSSQRSQEVVLRGEAAVDLEPVYLVRLGEKTVIDAETAAIWALEECADAFSGMVYGWEFDYEPGERARSLKEKLTLTALGSIKSEDPRIKISSASIRDNVYYLWCDFNLSVEQQFRLRTWNSADKKERAVRGYSPLEGPEGITERKMIKQSALEDAMKKAIRAALAEKERNRPRIAHGKIALSAFPIYRIFAGNWAAQARFRVEITEVIPFSAY